jgi:hypothetical protein
MITSDYLGRLGNNLFQASIAKQIAVDKDLYFEGVDYGFIKVKGHDGRKLTGHAYEVGRHENIIDFGAIPDDTPVHMLGFYQNVVNYNNIGEYIEIEDDIDVEYDDDSLLLNVRCGSDFNKRLVGLNYYEAAIVDIPHNKLYLMADDYDSDYCKYIISKYNPIIIEGNPEIHFKTIMKFKKVVMSNSTFCWWACALSRKDKDIIYSPMLNVSIGGAWSLRLLYKRDIDLRIDDSNFVHIYNVPRHYKVESYDTIIKFYGDESDLLNSIDYNEYVCTKLSEFSKFHKDSKYRILTNPIKRI